MPNAVNLSPPAIIKILCERCRKTTNSKAVGEPPSPDGFAFVPHTYHVLGRYRRVAELGSEASAAGASPFVPLFRFAAGNAPGPTEEENACAVAFGFLSLTQCAARPLTTRAARAVV